MRGRLAWRACALGTAPDSRLRRAETTALCESLGLVPVVDASNLDPRFQRNRVRHELLPLMESIAGRDVRPLVVRSSQHAREAADFISQSAGFLDGSRVADLRAAAPVLAREALRRWLRVDGYAPSTADLDRVWRVVQHEVIACEISGGRRVSRTGGVLRVEPA
ncbi:MAG: TilS substrate-binding domain-containing protein [Acidimicrobiales bacterium]